MLLTCDGPGPHNPPDGVLGEGSKPVAGLRCAAVACQPAPDQQTLNYDTIVAQAVGALVSNTAYIDLATPTNAQVAAQVKALTRQNNKIIRLVLGRLDGTD